MAQETNPRMTTQEAIALLEQVRQMLKLHGSMFSEIAELVKVSAEMGLDTVDSRLLVQIMQRHQETYRDILKIGDIYD